MPPLVGLTPEEAGRVLFAEALARNEGYGDLEVDLQMLTLSSRGSETRRGLKIRQMEMPDDGDRMLIVLDQPKTVRGTALLSHTHKDAVDDLWLYLPALKRVKRIAGRDRSGAFLASEFAYEDMMPQQLGKYSYRLLADSDASVNTSAPGQTVFVVERRPFDEYSGYSRQVVTLDADELRILRIEYFDRRERPLKTLVVEGYQLYEAGFWKPSRMVMTNHQTNRRTDFAWSNYRFDLGLDADRDFSTNSLLRAR